MSQLRLVSKPRTRKRHAAGKGAPAQIAHNLPRPTVRTISVISGKGGVGKSNVVANLAVAMAALGANVVVLDADFGQANQDLLLGVHPRADLLSVLRGDCALEDIVIETPTGVRLVPAGSGDPLLGEVDDLRRERLFREIGALAADADLLLIDTASGLSRTATGFALAAREVLLVTTPEPTAYADSYGMLKALSSQGLAVEPGVLVNLSSSPEDAEEVAHRLAAVSRRFLHLQLHSLGDLPLDPALPQAVKRQEPVVLAYPSCPSARSLTRLAERILHFAPDGSPSSWLDGDRECA